MSICAQPDSASYNTSTYSHSQSVERPRFKRYPAFPTHSQSLKNFIPSRWDVIDSVSGDLDGDRLADLSLVLQYRDTVMEMDPGSGYWETRPRMLLLLFKDRKGGLYRLALQNNRIIPRQGEGKQGGDPFGGVKIKDRTITIRGSMGGEYDFRYVNGDFYLVSAWTNGLKFPRQRYSSVYSTNDTYNPDTFYYYQIDFLKRKVLVEKSLAQPEEPEDPPWKREFGFARQSLIRLRDLREFDERKIFKRLVDQQ